MGYDITMEIAVRLEGSIEAKTENQIYVEHLNMTVSVYVPNNITKGTKMRLRGMGKSAPDGKKGDLYLKLISIDNDKVYRDIQYCGECGQKLTSDARFCHRCGTAVGCKRDDKNQRKQEWAGKIVKCPRCGEEIPSFVAKCVSCGYELRSSNPTNSVKELATKLEQVSNDSMKASLIRTFPIPNTKEDIIEFMILASTNIENSFQTDISEAWSVKFEQAYEKSKVIYGDMSEFDRCYDLFLRKKKENNKIIKRRDRDTKRNELALERKNKSIRKDEKSDKRWEHFTDFISKNNDWLVPILIFGLIFLVLGLMLLPHKFKEMELNKLVDEVEEYMEDGKYDKARVKAKQIVDDSDWSSESKKKWETVREALLETIDEKQATDEGKILVNYTVKDFIGQDCEEVKKKLEKQGFTNVQLQPMNDLITGWITKEGEVEVVTIGGRDDFKAKSYYAPDVEIVITYHSH